NTSERLYANTGNVRVFKIVDLKPTEVSLGGYVAKHYGKFAHGAGYTAPYTFNVLIESHIYKKGSKFYFLLAHYSLGDVYELKGADSITAKLKKFAETINPNSKAPANSGPYYGDKITFTSESTASVFPSVTWDFGDGLEQTASATSPDITHQYAGLAA